MKLAGKSVVPARCRTVALEVVSSAVETRQKQVAELVPSAIEQMDKEIRAILARPITTAKASAAAALAAKNQSAEQNKGACLSLCHEPRPCGACCPPNAHAFRICGSCCFGGGVLLRAASQASLKELLDYCTAQALAFRALSA